MVSNRSAARILPGRSRRPALPPKFAAAFNTLTYYAKRSIATDYERGRDFVKHLEELMAEHPIASLQRLSMPDGLDYIAEFLRIHRHPGEDAVVNEVYIPFLKSITNITARYNEGFREPLHSIVQELFDLEQFFDRIIAVLCQKQIRDLDSLVVFVVTCLATDRTIITFRTFIDLIHELLQLLNSSSHPSAGLIEHMLNGDLPKEAVFPSGIHDNDKIDFRHISIVPTIDEVLCKNLSDIYLPLADGSDGFLAEHPVGRLVDSAFRLHRHDMLYQIRSNLSNATGSLTYFNAKLTKRDDNYDNANLDIEFPVPEGTGRWFGLQGADGEGSSVECDSKWFPKGALVCLCRQERRPKFFGEITYNSAYDSKDSRKGAPRSSGNRFACTITVTIANWIDEDEIKEAIRFAVPFTLIQVCHGYFSYKPVLQSLQSIKLCPVFNALIYPETLPPSDDGPPPALASLLQSDPDFAKRFGQLDQVQKVACSLPFRDDLVVSLIQGPPGTGKTFIGTIVATGLIKFPSNKILCICFSNHQLDQFLEAIIDLGVTEVVRLGGRSHSDKLARYNLNNKIDFARNRLTEARRKTESFAETRRKVIEEARIIGCTATGAAIFRNILAKADCNILLIEEAGELLEANLLTSINKHTQKIVMIGDHMQLRPKVNNHDLSVEAGKGYDLNRSTFERLVYAGHPLVTLQCQHRMRPEISRIVRSLCYEDLTDAEKVKQYPNINGLKHNVIFVDHQYPESRVKTGGIRETADSSTTRINSDEALLTVKIALHMLKQGYSYEDLVILTPYLGQLNEIRIILEKQFKIKSILGDRDENEYDNALCSGLFSNEAIDSNGEQMTTFGIRVATVDNFQGEEALIVVASLVRSNPEYNIGFLKQVQRVNVLISRAKAGLILVGNATCLKKASPLWDRVLSYVHIAFGLPAICQRHNANVFMKTVEDFDELSPFGGCTTVCNLTLPCGHHCKKTCHDPVQIEHEVCAMKHPALCPSGHRIKTSSVDKRKCQMDVYAVCPTCSNVMQRKCSDIARESNCLYCRFKKLIKSVAIRLEDQFKSKIRRFSEFNDRVISECEIFAAEDAENFGKRLLDICKVMVPQLHRLLEGFRKHQELNNPRSLGPMKCAYCQIAIFNGESFRCQSQKICICYGCVRIRAIEQLKEAGRLACPCSSPGCRGKSLEDAKLLPCLDEAALLRYYESGQIKFYNGLIEIAQNHFQR